MTVYILLYVLVFLCDFISQDSRVIPLIPRQRKLFFLTFCSLFILVILCFKDFAIGSDTRAYISIYNKSLTNPIVWNNEFGFVFLNKVFKKFDAPFRLFWIVYCVFVVFTYTWIIYKYSKDSMISICAYLALGLFPMTMSGMRQMICVGLFLIALPIFFKALDTTEKKGKRIAFFFAVLLIFFLGRTIHSSMLFLLPVLLVSVVRIPRGLYVTGIIVSLLLSFIGRPLVQFVVSFTPYAYYLNIPVEREYLVIIRSFLIIVAFFISCRTNLFKKNDFIQYCNLSESDVAHSLEWNNRSLKDVVFDNLLLFNFLFICLSNIAILFERVYYYTAISEVVLMSFIPFAFKEKVIIRYVIVLLLVCSFFLTLDGTGVGIFPYKFAF